MSKLMTQEEAFRKAEKLWGMDAIVGRNFNYAKTFHVGKKGTLGIWEKRGAGNSFEEAFENVVDWPDGKKPVTVNL